MLFYILVLQGFQKQQIIKWDTSSIVKSIERAKELKIKFPEFEDCFNSKTETYAGYKAEINPYGVITIFDNRGRELMSAPVRDGKCNGWQHRVAGFAINDVLILYMDRNIYFVYRLQNGSVVYKMLTMNVQLSKYQLVPIFGISDSGDTLKFFGGSLREDRYFYGYLYYFIKSKRQLTTTPFEIESSIQFDQSRQLR
ncbi:MAG: hypothetical protein N2504_02905 [candidate division WOR-3 bacterium]|nr:hypothetical protein [candidate division WOR-3 bacterium]MCX7947520.1 hypothetical protein [candidate division WOR-3 bacterium]MDW8150406.1 hypothetical protein [candidate division WOR-3 bacterium]